ncbi:MAG: outer membrane lipid asymmetry maintenance protein MlaD [Candidatus Brocadiaceae bacterium]|nr:outer membrane lipid asymmetry maintenance protein MlaD [Candidatus Brocadiaceae bacterium]
MKAFHVEMTVGAFMVLGILCLGYLSVRLGGLELWGRDYQQVDAVFSNVGGLRAGAPVMVAGVTVGRIGSITLEEYAARVVLEVRSDLELQEDAIASIKTQGLIGEKFVEISPGGSEELIPPGGRIAQTEPAFDWESLIGKYAFGDI